MTNPQQIDVVNLSKRVTEREVRAMVAAWSYQLRHHYAPSWLDVAIPIAYAGSGQDAADRVPAGHVLHTIEEEADEPDAGAYHTEDDRGRKLIKTFVAPYLGNGGTVLGDPSDADAPSVSSAGSHENLELSVDPPCNRWRDDGRVTFAEEPCDPVEGDGYHVRVLDPSDRSKTLLVSVSNFVLPSWFDPLDRVGPWDYLRRAQGPFKMTPGGYVVVRTGGPGTEQQKFADKAAWPDWKLELKSASRRLMARGLIPSLGDVLAPTGSAA